MNFPLKGHALAAALVAATLVAGCSTPAPTQSQAQSQPQPQPQPQSTRFAELANAAFAENRPTPEAAKLLADELLFQRATQGYLWSMPLLNTMGMRDGFAESFGTGYNVMGIWEKRLDAKTLITTPNSDLIYGMVFEDLSKTGPLVFDAPPKMQGILLDMWQRPIPMDGGKFFGDIGLPGPDAGAGGKFLILPPGYKGNVPKGYYVYRSATNNIFIFLRSFYQSLDNIQPAVDLLKQSKLYPLGKQASAKPMEFKYASEKVHNMLPRSDIAAFRQLKWLVDAEGKNLADADGLGILAGAGIIEGKKFEPDARTTEILGHAAKTAYKMSRVIGMQDHVGDVDLRVFKDRQWTNPVNNLSSRWPNAYIDLNWTDTKVGYRNNDARIWMFTDYYSISPGMVTMTPGKGAFYYVAFKDAAGDWLHGKDTYKLTLPPKIPAQLFWSVTLYEAENASGLANGQPFPSIGKLNNPVVNADGTTDIYVGPTAPPGKEANWLASVPGKGYFSILRLYAPTAPALDLSWKPGDFVKMQ